MYFEAVFRFYVLLNHFVGHFFFGLVRFGSFSNTIYRNLALALSKLHINVDITVGFFVGQKNYRLSDAVDNDLDSLYSVDLVFVSEHTDAALLQNIAQDGIIVFDRYIIRFQNFSNAVECLQEGIQAYQERPETIIRDGVIQRFEFTCELAWKTTREFLLDQGFTELNSPKATMRKAFSYGLIDDEQAWIALLNARNQTSHLYDDATAQEIYSQIESEFVSLFDNLIEQLKRG